MYQPVLLSLCLLTLAAGISEEQQYCALRYRRLCQGKGRHIACQFPDGGPGPSCERYTQIKFTNELKHFITHYLNRRRQRIASGNERVRGGVHLPKPQIMMLVEWDRELAYLAQRLADQCHFVHDDCRATVKYPYAGQTVGEVRWRRSSESDELSALRGIRRVFDAWWGERRRVQPKQLTAPFRLAAKGTVWGHFSQLAVWNLQAVGCGAVRHGARHPRLLLVCDFSHTNMLGQRTLVPGPMTPCPIHTARKLRTAYPALCGPVRHRAPQEPDDGEVEENYDDDGSDDSETVDVGDVSTPSVWVKRTNQEIDLDSKESIHSTDRYGGSARELPDDATRVLNTQHFRMNPGPFAVTMSPIIPQKETFRQVLERDGEQMRGDAARKKVMLKKEQFFDPLVRPVWSTKSDESERPFIQWRQGQGQGDLSNSDRDLEQVLPLSAPRQKSKESRIMEAYRPTLRDDGNDVTEPELQFRPRWQQTRQRHQRPGANALSYTTTGKQSKKPGFIPINLDKEDIDQFFRDTGFNLHWRKSTTT